MVFSTFGLTVFSTLGVVFSTFLLVAVVFFGSAVVLDDFTLCSLVAFFRPVVVLLGVVELLVEELRRLVAVDDELLLVLVLLSVCVVAVPRPLPEERDDTLVTMAGLSVPGVQAEVEAGAGLCGVRI